MARLTVANVTADLLEKGMSLTGKSGSYTVVMPNGYSFTLATLHEIVAGVASIEAQKLKEFVDTIEVGETEELEIEPICLTMSEPTEEEIAVAGNERVLQVVTYCTERGIGMTRLLNCVADDDSPTYTALPALEAITVADKRTGRKYRAERHNHNHRCSNSLLRRGKRFFDSLK